MKKGRRDVVVGIGDDAAVCAVPENQQLVITTDMLVAGVHFPEDTPAHAIGYKSLAVNLSDLAAMGATPAWFTLNLSLPESEESWLEEFSDGLQELAEKSGIELVGGDTVRGPLCIGIQACGTVPSGSAVLRSGAKAGDRVFVTGSVGDAALGLKVERDEQHFGTVTEDYFLRRLRYPIPRNIQGSSLINIASAMIDISDGLIADLGHVLERSGVGATIELSKVPLSPDYRNSLHENGWDPALSNGDDYELCITVAPEHIEPLMQLASEWDCGISEIGTIESQPGLRIIDVNGEPYEPLQPGYDHFKG